MTPAKSRDLIPGLAVQIGIPEEDLTNMLSFYFKENKRIASSLQVNHIILRGLGTLSIQGWKIEDKIKECTDTEQLSLLTKALSRWKQEKELKVAMAIKKKQFYENKKLNDETQGNTSNGVEK